MTFKSYGLLMMFALFFAGALSFMVSNPAFAALEGGGSGKAVTKECADGLKVKVAADATKKEIEKQCKKAADKDKKEKEAASGKLTCNILPQFICNSAGNKTTDAGQTGIMKFLVWVIQILTALVGIVAVGALVYAGILYSSASDDSGQVSKAKGIIQNTVIGLVAYALMFLLLNWLIPGGVIG